MFKKYLFLCTLLLTSGTVLAADFYPAGPLNSPLGHLMREIIAEHNDPSVKFRAKQTGSCGESVSLFENSDEPVAIVMTMSMYRNTRRKKQKCDIDFTKATPIMSVQIAHTLCHKPDFKLEDRKGEKMLLGVVRPSPYNIHLDYFNKNNLGIKFFPVLQKSSSKATIAIINGDVDVGYPAYSSAKLAVKKGTLVCPYVAGILDNSVYPEGTKSMSELFDEPLPDLTNYTLWLMVFTRNMTPEQNAKLISDIQPLSQKLKESQQGTGIKIGLDKNDVKAFLDNAERQRMLD